MRHSIILLFLLVFSVSFAQNYPFQNTSLPLETRVDDLLRRLTLEEKLSLMVHQNPAIERLGLKPYSWWNEALHGVARNGIATVYPMPIALAATFDSRLIEMSFNQIANEAHQKFVESQANESYGDNTGLTFFSPNINLFRDPRWGRGMETFGEDPYLTARMGAAVVRGLQGNDPTKLVAGACIKHLAVHSGPEGLRHEFDSKVSMRDLWTTYLPAFEYIIKNTNVQQVMCGYNRLNGVPCCTNKELIVDILRNKWHYDGLMVTDCWALNDCWERDTVIPRHKTHATAALTAGDAFGSEIDLECGSGLPALRTAVDSGYISITKINEHVRRILRARLMVGVDNPIVQSNPNYNNFNSGSGENLALATANSSIVLLKNNGILPLQRSSMSSVAVVGPNAADSAVAVGNYNGTPQYVQTVKGAFEFLRYSFGKFYQQNGAWTWTSFRLYHNRACNLVDETYKPDRRFWRNLKRSNVIVFVGGLSPDLEGEELQVELPGFHKGDRTQIELPEAQVKMIKEIKRRTHKPIVLVLYTGSAIALENVVDDVDAIMVGWYGGQEIGSAVVSALTNKEHPFGCLPVTFYKNTNQLPAFDDYSMKGRTYRYMDEKPLYPFGYGLSYYDVKISDIQFNRKALSLTCKTACGGGSHVIQVYLQNLDDPKGPKRSLVQFDRANKETSTLTFQISEDQFRYFSDDTQELEMPKAGTRYRLYVGTSSALGDLQHIDFVW